MVQIPYYRSLVTYVGRIHVLRPILHYFLELGLYLRHYKQDNVHRSEVNCKVVKTWIIRYELTHVDRDEQ